MSPQEVDGHRMASEMEVQIFAMVLMSVAVAKAMVDGLKV